VPESGSLERQRQIFGSHDEIWTLAISVPDPYGVADLNRDPGSQSNTDPYPGLPIKKFVCGLW
jgi:hypothetical protein